MKILDRDLNPDPYETVLIKKRAAEERDELGEREQASEMSLDDGVTLAGGGFEARAVDDNHASVSVVDQSRALECADRERHRRTTDAQHDG